MTKMEFQDDAGMAASEYQSLSPLAAIALVLGLLSPAALATPLLMVVPAAAAGAALLALVHIRASDGALTGARLARCGLFLAVMCGVATLVRDPVRNALMRRQTAAVAQQWLTLLGEGRIDDAIVLVGGRGMQSLGPPPPASPEAEPPKMEEVMTIARGKLRNDPLTLLAASLERPIFVAAAPDDAGTPLDDGTRVTLIEDLMVRGAGSAPGTRVRMQFVRMPVYETEGRPWRLESWQVVAPAEDAAAAGGETP